MYSVKNDECPYDESYNVGCVIILGDLKYLTRDTFRIDSLVSGIFHIFQALTGCFYAFFYRFNNQIPNGLAGAQNQPFLGTRCC